jgi:hypothetical protein
MHSAGGAGPHRLVADAALPPRALRLLSWAIRGLAHDGHSPSVSVITAYELARCEPRLLPLLVRGPPPTRATRCRDARNPLCRRAPPKPEHQPTSRRAPQALPARQRLPSHLPPTPSLPTQAAASQAVLGAVEAAFGREAELYVEWSGLISWRAGAAIDWHHDANRSAARRSTPEPRL